MTKSEGPSAPAREGGRDGQDSKARDRGLRDAIVDALRRGRLSLAQRLADAAARLERTSPSLAAAIMRVRLRQSLPSAALSASEVAARLTAELHLLRAVSHLEIGQWLEGQLELTRAAARGRLCPAGLQLLAHLEESGGDRGQTRSLLNELRGAGAEQRALALLLCDAVEAGERTRASEIAEELLACAVIPAQRAEVQAMLAWFGLAVRASEPQASPKQVDCLAAELTMMPACLPALVEAQRRELDQPSALLLRRALEISAERMIDPAAAHAAIVELTLLLDGPLVAARVVRQAVAAFPMSTLLRAVQERIHSALDRMPQERVGSERGDIIATIGRDGANPLRRSAAA